MGVVSKLFYNMCGNQIDRHLFITRMSARQEQMLNVILAITVIVVVLFVLVLFSITLALEIRNATIFLK